MHTHTHIHVYTHTSVFEVHRATSMKIKNIAVTENVRNPYTTITTHMLYVM